ncbi:MAG TPA: 1-(5-phosphoribosyl)-5-[(5-phosphoribosylamino)methylideneamino]imidazole-4-carboxamide isomerase [Spirochaetia bacterium]|nr:1-(5-phosphoribosyl)-5-[(5-phosphoribosylamino)methylideneamino]imidazole-4-carboxamide isomerase [Spirochaetia bacterium]
MLLVPAIDLRGGRCVRLFKGSFSSAKSYPDDPVETARGFEEKGIRWIHIVDLDAAEGKGRDNRPTVERIRRSVSCRLEVGGGVRSVEHAAQLFDLGVDLVILGTVLVRSPGEVASWIKRLGRRFIGGIDARDGVVMISGWTESGGRADTDVAAELSAVGLQGLIYTNINRDGTLEGPDVERTNLVARASGLSTLVSGGIGSREDVEQAANLREPLVAGVILGKALYEGRVDLAELVKAHPQTAAASVVNVSSPWG